MKNKWFLLFIVPVILASAAACTNSPTITGLPPATDLTQSATSSTYSDPFAYCAAVGQVDTPDARYTGPMMSDELFNDYLIAAGLDPSMNYPDTFKQMTIWRCMDARVYTCNFGANIPCNSKADTNKIPSQAMNDFCVQNPDSTFIPMSVTGHSTIYSWHCDNTTAEVLDQIDTVDAAGYASSFWTPLTKNSGAANAAAQSTQDVTSPVASQKIVFYSNRDGGANNIYLLTIGNTTPFILTKDQNGYFSGPFSPDGSHLLFTGFGLTNSYVGLMNADGSDPVNLTNQENSDDAFPAWSPDGAQIVFTSNRDGNNEIYLMDTTGGHINRLTNAPKDDFAPSWSPDGQKIAFLSDRDNETGFYSIYLMSPDGSNVMQLTDDHGNDYTPSWSPDGSMIVFRSIQKGQSDIFTIAADGSGLTNLTNSSTEEWSPAWSPDGSQIAFQTNRDGNWEIYLMNADGSDPVNVTNDPADDQVPFWKP